MCSVWNFNVYLREDQFDSEILTYRISLLSSSSNIVVGHVTREELKAEPQNWTAASQKTFQKQMWGNKMHKTKFLYAVQGQKFSKEIYYTTDAENIDLTT